MVVLNVNLNITRRLELVQKLFNENVTINSSFNLNTVSLVVDPDQNISSISEYIHRYLREVWGKSDHIFHLISGSFTGSPRICVACEVKRTGACYPNAVDRCDCFTGWTGDFCLSLSPTSTASAPLQSSATTNWTIIVAIVSAVAGLLLIIAIAMCVSYLMSKRHRATEK